MMLSTGSAQIIVCIIDRDNRDDCTQTAQAAMPAAQHTPGICRDTYAVLEKSKKVTKFLNRMLAMSLRDQKLLFTYFSDTLVRLGNTVCTHSCFRPVTVCIAA